MSSDGDDSEALFRRAFRLPAMDSDDDELEGFRCRRGYVGCNGVQYLLALKETAGRIDLNSQ